MLNFESQAFGKIGVRVKYKTELETKTQQSLEICPTGIIIIFPWTV